MVEIKDRLYELMTKLNITQADIIKSTGIPKSTLSMYLSGDRKPKQDKITLICDAYGINETWLMGYENVPMMKSKIIEEIPEYDSDIFEIISLLDKITKEQKCTILSILRSFADNNKEL